jgi:hypothetical protein
VSDVVERDLERAASQGDQEAARKLIQQTLRATGDPLVDLVLPRLVRMQRYMFAVAAGGDAAKAFAEEVKPTDMLGIVRGTSMLRAPPSKAPPPRISVEGDCQGNPALRNLVDVLQQLGIVSDGTELGKPVQGSPGEPGPPGEALQIKDQNGSYQKVSNLELPPGASLWQSGGGPNGEAAWQLDLECREDQDRSAP